MRSLTMLFLGLAALCGAARAENLPDFTPEPGAIGTIRLWGSPEDGKLLGDWQNGFRKFHPDAQILAELHGPDSAMAGVYTGVADLAFLSREMRLPVERMAFEWEYHHPATQVQIANGGMAPRRPGAALAVFVNAGNPLASMSLAQLDAIYGGERRRGLTPIRRWGELGLNGVWKDRPIRVYGPPVDSISAAFLRDRVLKGSYKWTADYSTLPDDPAALVARLAVDPAGIVFAPLAAGSNAVKALALAEDGDSVVPERDTLVSRAYPLSRSVALVLNCPPGQKISPKVKEFLRFVLSRQGQDAIERDGQYLPLSPETARRQRAILEAPGS